ncbi:MAG TPA: hypothetical protein VEC38_10195 [Candidatus Binataceae bacterium]|nr:hypothetical protein [Candidatus Binataceae bacterium]
MKRLSSAGVLCLVLACAGCGLFGSTGTNAANPTGLPEPNVVKQMTLSISVPEHATVAANCAAGDTNSCSQASDIAAFCKATAGIPEAFRKCVLSNWATN